MGVTFLGLPRSLASWAVQEDASSLDRGEAPSGVPQFTAMGPGDGQVLGAKGRRVAIESPFLGATRAVVLEARQTAAAWTVTSGTPLSRLNQVGNVSSATGVRADVAVRLFFSAVGVTRDEVPLIISESLAPRLYSVPSARDNVWAQFRLWLSANELDIRWVVDTLYLVPWRDARVVVQDVTADYTIQQQEGAMAKRVDCNIYHRTKFERGIILPGTPSAYPGASREFGHRGGDTALTLSVGAGEVAEQEIDLPCEVASIWQPRHVLSLPISNGQPNTQQILAAGGMYAVVGKDNKPITPAQWADQGGSLTVKLSDDRKRVTVRLTGANYLDLAPYRVAESDGEKDYTGLYLVGGPGTWIDVETVRFDTGAPGTDDVQEIDNPAIVNRTDAYRAAQDLAAACTGHQVTATWQGPDPVRSGWKDRVRQSFGRLAGARFFLHRQWWRALSVRYSDGTVDVSADRDPLLSDIARVYPTPRSLQPGGATLREISDKGIL